MANEDPIESLQSIAQRLADAAEKDGLQPTTFCLRKFGNSKLVARLRNDGDICLSTYRKIINEIGLPDGEAEHEEAA